MIVQYLHHKKRGRGDISVYINVKVEGHDLLRTKCQSQTEGGQIFSLMWQRIPASLVVSTKLFLLISILMKSQSPLICT